MATAGELKKSGRDVVARFTPAGPLHPTVLIGLV